MGGMAGALSCGGRLMVVKGTRKTSFLWRSLPGVPDLRGRGQRAGTGVGRRVPPARGVTRAGGVRKRPHG
ncbi:hypothetical protein GCM10023082_31190 [Streptomyces tremellae]|uniref:Transposase n=1 Tax=Streptomyces tremellae TaxID=1124239 RepID=A0ABP7F7J4_9ACTN